MYSKGHIGINALLFAPIALILKGIFSFEMAVIGALFCVGAASFPDIDRLFAGMTNKTQFWTIVPISHRGITHTIWFALLTGGVGLAASFFVLSSSEFGLSELLSGFIPNYNYFVLSACIGGSLVLSVVGHIIGDVITPSGVRPFKPIKNREYMIGFVHADGKIFGKESLEYGNKIFFAIGLAVLLIVLGV
jgi:inner membrane protein